MGNSDLTVVVLGNSLHEYMEILHRNKALHGLLRTGMLQDTIIDVFTRWVGTQRISRQIRCVPISFWYAMFQGQDGEAIQGRSKIKRARLLKNLRQQWQSQAK